MRATHAWLVGVVLASCGGARPASNPPPGRAQSPAAPAPPFDGEVHVHETGPADGPPMVLVHGLGERASADFDPIVPALAAEHRVLAVDLPGFGRSDGGNHLYSPDFFVAVLERVLATRVQRPFVLVGHSMGGAIALQYAASHPHRVSRLVVIDAAGILHRDAYTSFLVRAQIDGVLGSAVTTVMNPLARRGPRPETILHSEIARATVLGGDPGRIAALALILHDFGPALDAIGAPTLVLWGEKDEVAPLRTARLLESRLAPLARLEVLDGAGHVPMAEDPDWVSARILEWLAVPPPAPPPPPTPGTRIERCDGHDGAVFEGAYDRIELHRCRDAVLRRVVARQLVLRDSVATLDRVTVVDAPGTGVLVDGSVVRMTGGRVRAHTCFHVTGSELDIAGTILECGDAAFAGGERPTKLILSVVRATSRRGRGSMHEVRVLDGGARL